MRTALLMALLLALLAAPLVPAGSIEPRPGWRSIPTQQGYAELLEAVRAAVPAEGMGLVTDVGPTEVAARRGEEIPGNRVLGVFRNDFAVRALRASVAAMIEAPIRFYVTEERDGTATLSWKAPSHVFAPYFDEGGDALRDLASELDRIFEAIAERATAGE